MTDSTPLTEEQLEALLRTMPPAFQLRIRERLARAPAEKRVTLCRQIVERFRHGDGAMLLGKTETRTYKSKVWANAPTVGERAPDFELTQLHHEEYVRLSDHLGRPVGLIFGSYTCPRFRHVSARLESIYRQYRERIDFYVVYIREAHTADGWLHTADAEEGLVFEQPRTLGERERLAEACSLGLSVTVPMLVDSITDDASLAYGAFPGRLYLIDPHGRIAYRGGPDAEDYEVDGWEAAIVGLLADQ